jgi:hypothetical protein
MKNRICHICGNEFQPIRPSNRCKPCINKIANDKRRGEIEEKKAAGLYRGMRGRPVDLDGKYYGERAKEWRDRRKFLDTIYDRNEWRTFFSEEFDRIESDTELWSNLTRPTLAEDVRGANSIKPKQRGVIGRPKGSSNLYPDTRNINIDDISKYRMGED